MVPLARGFPASRAIAAVFSARTPARSVAELLAYALVVIAATVVLERPLIVEILGYLGRRRRPERKPVAAVTGAPG